MTQCGRGVPVAKIATNYAEILDRIGTGAPDTRVYVQSVLPRGSDYEERVLALNREIRRMAEERGLPYIDLYPAFVADDGSIQDELANDELHLLGTGYARWKAILDPYVMDRR